MSIMQVCWSLIRYPRSKGIPYIMENGTFDEALVFISRLFGIMLGLSVVENVIIFFITPATMLDTIISILGFVFAWIFLKGLWLILALFYILCSLGLYRQMLKTTSMHIIIIAIVYTVLLISASMMLRV